MLRVQELEIDGVKYRLREPRIADYIAGQGKDSDILTSVAMLGGMLLDEKGKPIGEEAAMNLPLAAFDRLAVGLSAMMNKPRDPLLEPNGSSSDLPLP